MEKKLLIIIAVLAVALIVTSAVLFAALHRMEQQNAEAAAAAAAEPSPTPIPTPEPTPSGTPAVVLAPQIGLVGERLARGTAVTVTGELDGWFAVTLEDGRDIFVEKRFIRLESEEEFVPYSVFAAQETPLYDNPYREGEPFIPQAGNELLVVDTVGTQLVVEYIGRRHCVPADTVSGYAPVAYDPYAYAYSDYSGGGDFSGGGGDYSDGGGDYSGGGGEDGGEIVLSYHVGGSHGTRSMRLNRVQKRLPSVQGIIRADNVEACLCVFERGDSVRVVNRGERLSFVVTEKGIGTLPTCLLRPDGDPEPEEQSAQTAGSCRLYADHRRWEASQILELYEPVTVLDELDGLYIVAHGKELGYMPIEDVLLLTPDDSRSITTDGSMPTNPGTAPTDPGTAPTDPGSTPTDPGTAPTDPGTAPVDPGSTPTDPGSTPTDPGSTPTDPGSTPTDPGSTPTDPGGGEWTPETL